MKRSIQMPAFILLISLMIFGFHQQTVAQDADVYKKISEMVVAKDFVFVAESLTPMGGQLRVLTSPYEVKVFPDSVLSYLPYFGKSQQVPVANDDNGMIFTSTKFDYDSKTGKKKTWNVTIKFKDQKNTSTFNFTIYDNAEASLNITSMRRDPISFRGHIKM
ncbi:MAG: DUF4251 domain-containing protein [Ferruginibacter sp.]